MWTQLQLLKTTELMDSLSWYKNFRAASWFNLKMLPVDWPYLWPYHWLKSASSMPSPTIRQTWKASRQFQPGFSFASYLCLLLCSDMLLSWSRNTGRYRFASFSFEKLFSHCRTARTNFNYSSTTGRPPRPQQVLWLLVNSVSLSWWSQIATKEMALCQK